MSRLSELRHGRGLTQEYVSEKCNINLCTLQKYEQGKSLRNAKAGNVFILAKFYDVSMEYLLEYTDSKKTIRI